MARKSLRTVLILAVIALTLLVGVSSALAAPYPPPEDDSSTRVLGQRAERGAELSATGTDAVGVTALGLAAVAAGAAAVAVSRRRRQASIG